MSDLYLVVVLIFAVIAIFLVLTAIYDLTR
jgi:hypothetical protein